jgi:hypothetical protein
VYKNRHDKESYFQKFFSEVWFRDKKRSVSLMSDDNTILTLACEEKNQEALYVVSQGMPPKEGILLRINKIGLSANNKFYLAFGRNPTFQFFSAYPISDTATVIDSDAPSIASLVHPPAWGLATVVESTIPQVPVGSLYQGMLPLGSQVHFNSVVPKEEGDFAIVRPKTLAAYNDFTKIDPVSTIGKGDEKADIALTCWPGIITGFGLYHELIRQNFYRSNHEEKRVVVLSSASSKVSLAAAFYLKQNNDLGVAVIGYTSDQNRDFCESTGLYDQVLSYNTDFPETDEAHYIFIDVAGRGEVYARNEASIVKALVIGNSQDVSDAASTSAQFGLVTKIKVMLMFMGLGSIASYLRPKLDLFLIVDIRAALSKEWGHDGFKERSENAMQDFVTAAVDKKWIQRRSCTTLKSVREGYSDIVKGIVPPSEAIVLDVSKALESVKVDTK